MLGSSQRLQESDLYVAPNAIHSTLTDRILLVKSFSSLADAERFLAGENPSHGGGSSSPPTTKFYAVKNGRHPGIYTDWPSAQEQITGWTKPKHRCFTTRVEAQRFLDGDEQKAFESSGASDADPLASVFYHASEPPTQTSVKPLVSKKAKRGVNGTSKATKPVEPEYNETDYEPGTGPLPPGAEDGFDPNIILDGVTGEVVYKTLEQRQATKPQAAGDAQTGIIRIHTDGSSLGNGKAGAFAGVGVYFGPGDSR